MKNYQLYLFDFDYTLADSSAGIVKCFQTTLEKSGLPAVEKDTICRTVGLPMREAVMRITQNRDEAACDAFIAAYKKEADRYMTPMTHFYPQTIPLLTELKARGAKVGIISSKTRSRIAEKFVQDGYAHLIDHIIGSDDVKTLKPSPEGILAALQHFGLEHDKILYTGDNLVDAQAAQNAKVDFAAVTTGTTPAADFAAYPHIAILFDIGQLINL
ncbi:putative phosphatase [Selenomonas ruminantium subsp. lactilytica TAM6421]|uniref:Putative phosphatase n=1 Tax=Selenomonas ruminantium subsp. lactilytica (strain NBRC 103574 / TAM6421) TaxID=927704 RepID=I0GR28_SELRL|nr:HAD-IA family hydrolase [Selenomonas ruminantium]BAL83215.1 putative phosphatase [Selenomonas ruminantium subsp. lactilytica TAM6421]